MVSKYKRTLCASTKQCVILKYLGYSKEGAAKEGMSKCIENFSNFTEIDNNGCYLHYSSQVAFGG